MVMRAQLGEVAIEYEVFGPADGPPIVLIAGIFQQLTFWPAAFVDQLVDAGFRVVVLDNRDVGLSTLETRPAPDLMTVLGGDASGVNYTLSDMAADTAGLIDALGFESAHVFGHSMGGMIAQRLAIEFPHRVRSLTLFGTGPSDGVSGQSSPEFLALAIAPVPTDPDEMWETSLAAYRICVVPDPVDEDELATFARAQLDRAPNPQMQCLPAILGSAAAGLASSPTHIEELQALEHPTLVIHGTGDLAVAVDGGERLAEVIPDAKFVPLEGMGHVPLAPGRWKTIGDAVIAHASKA
jgi:pimeloyl-ACP methyl ester carboxylesterase